MDIQRPLVATPARGVTRKSIETRRRILEAAVTVLRDRGHSGFTIPRVAAAAGLYQGNVTYYYPTRVDMLVALVDHIVGVYRQHYDDMLGNIDPDDPSWADAFVVWLFDDAISPDNVRLFPELWSIANQVPAVADAVARMFSDAIDALVAALGHDPADPVVDEMREVLTLLFAVTIGNLVMNGHRNEFDRVLVDTRDRGVNLIAPLLAASNRRAAERRSVAPST